MEKELDSLLEDSNRYKMKTDQSKKLILEKDASMKAVAIAIILQFNCLLP